MTLTAADVYRLRDRYIRTNEAAAIALTEQEHARRAYLEAKAAVGIAMPEDKVTT
jgi:hypothetical protein